MACRRPHLHTAIRLQGSLADSPALRRVPCPVHHRAPPLAGGLRPRSHTNPGDPCGVIGKLNGLICEAHPANQNCARRAANGGGALPGVRQRYLHLADRASTARKTALSQAWTRTGFSTRFGYDERAFDLADPQFGRRTQVFKAMLCDFRPSTPWLPKPTAPGSLTSRRSALICNTVSAVDLPGLTTEIRGMTPSTVEHAGGRHPSPALHSGCGSRG